eukprot:20826-Eustigmatos_ZCMA.PRE.1
MGWGKALLKIALRADERAWQCKSQIISGFHPFCVLHNFGFTSGSGTGQDNTYHLITDSEGRQLHPPRDGQTKWLVEQ